MHYCSELKRNLFFYWYVKHNRKNWGSSHLCVHEIDDSYFKARFAPAQISNKFSVYKKYNFGRCSSSEINFIDGKG